MTTTVVPEFRLPAGYTVSERLGEGGFGEVWKATAPGGVDKAIKIVFGRCDENLAERELKSLERIKRVRHPFVLSIERFEVVDSRLVIVTELADMSLEACFQRHRENGRPGIPRRELLGYLWDAAEALDWLVDRHSLQHLDIKPENLLLVGDHIKIADFGTVKELISRTQNSLMGGMTPIYSAPEIYDDNPSPRSDPYSLAIVYQQMLTGVLPFPGRTPAQLAKQHIQAEPNLQSLSADDRRVVARALAKKPDARFSNCREFVAALRSGGKLKGPASKPSAWAAAVCDAALADEERDTKSVAVLKTSPLEPIRPEDDAAPPQRPARQAELAKTLPPFPDVSAEVRDIAPPDMDGEPVAADVATLFIGIGGLGQAMLTRVRQEMGRLAEEGAANQPATAWLAIDTDQHTLNDTLREGEGAGLPALATLHTPLRRPREYRDVSQDLLRWVSRRWLYNIPRSLQTRGFRPLGRIAVVDHAQQVVQAVHARLKELAPSGDDVEVRVVLLAGMSGGSGAGSVIDVAQAVRAVCRRLSLNANVLGVLACTFRRGSNDSLAAANMYSLVTELSHAQRHGNCGESPLPGAAGRFESKDPPFDDTYVAFIPPRGSGSQQALQSVGRYLAIDASGAAARAVKSLRSNPQGQDRSLLMRTPACVALDELRTQLLLEGRQRLTRAVIEWWLAPGHDTSDSDPKLFGDHAGSRIAREVVRQLPPPAPVENEEDQAAAFRYSEALKKRRTLVQLAADAVASLVANTSPPDCDDDPPANPLDHDEVEKVGQQIIAELCRALANARGESASQLLQSLANDCVAAAVESQLERDPSRFVERALSQADVRPLDCGFDRSTLLLTPSQATPPYREELTRQRPTTKAVSAGMGQSHLICEGSGLRPLHLASRLAEEFPDIAEAAGRMHARNDIKWGDLRNEAARETA